MRRLQLELSQEREKFNQLLLKHQDLQQQCAEEQQLKQKMVMEIDCKATEIEHLQSKLNETASLSSADNDPEDSQVSIAFQGTGNTEHSLTHTHNPHNPLPTPTSTPLCSPSHRTRSSRAG